MAQRKMTKREAMEWAKSLPDDDADDATVHVVRVKKSDPRWDWLFGPSKPSDEADGPDDDTDDDADGKPEPEPKPRNKFFGGQ